MDRLFDTAFRSCSRGQCARCPQRPLRQQEANAQNAKMAGYSGLDRAQGVGYAGADPNSYEWTDHLEAEDHLAMGHPPKSGHCCGACIKWSCLLTLLLLLPCLVLACVPEAQHLLPEDAQQFFQKEQWHPWTNASWADWLHHDLLPSADGWLADVVHAVGPHLKRSAGATSSAELAAQAECGGGDEQTWPLQKRSRCCRSSGRGCAPDNKYDCRDGAAAWTQWPLGKKFFCCGYDLSGCESKPTTTTLDLLAFNCELELDAWAMKWSQEKKQYCCKRYNFGCGGTTSAVPYDCQTDLAIWRKAWSDDKTIWCCEHERVGCQKNCTTVAQTDLVSTRCTDEPEASTSAPAAMPSATASTTSTTVVTTAVPLIEDPASCHNMCSQGHEQASCKERLEWILHEPPPHGLQGLPNSCGFAKAVVVKDCDVCTACPISETSCRSQEAEEEKHDCMETNKSPTSSWSVSKSTWCCVVQGKACPTGWTPDKFECVTDVTAWGKVKADWCCHLWNMSCPP